jgi:drug/metabolite transporter (DMT)-like permease
VTTSAGRRANAALLAITLIWAANWTVMKVALTYADPFVFNAQRTLLACGVLFVVLAARRGPWWPESWRAVAVTGLLQVSVNFLATAMALVEGGAGRTSVLVFTMPFWTLLIAWPVLGERPRGAKWWAIALAFAGLLLIVAPWSWEGALASKFYAVVGGLGWAAAAVATKYFQRAQRFDPVNFIAWHLLIGMVPFIGIAVLREAPSVALSLTYVACVAYAGVVSIAIAWLLWISILTRLSASAAGFSMLAIPVLAIGISVVFFGEPIARSEWWGMALIAAGLALLGLLARRGARPPASIETESPT